MHRSVITRNWSQMCGLKLSVNKVGNSLCTTRSNRMTTVRGYPQAVVIGMASLLFAQAAMATTKFASDEVASAAKGSVASEVLAARGRLDEAFAAQDLAAVSELFAKDLIVNTPANRVARREQVLGFFKAGRMNYESADVTIEALDARDDEVVIMGEEVVKPRDAAANAGKTVSRRFTDVWRRESDGKWRLTLRQATITSVK
jgi:ketosteroid isomerase-like protein